MAQLLVYNSCLDGFIIQEWVPCERSSSVPTAGAKHYIFLEPELLWKVATSPCLRLEPPSHEWLWRRWAILHRNSVSWKTERVISFTPPDHPSFCKTHILYESRRAVWYTSACPWKHSRTGISTVQPAVWNTLDLRDTKQSPDKVW